MDQRRPKRVEPARGGSGPIYLDCNATTPIEPSVRDVVLRFLDEEFGNAASRTHEYGLRAKRAVEDARGHVAAVVEAKAEEVHFTSGATESNNLALLGLAAHGERTGRKHIVSTTIEHKAVLEPLEELRRRGFSVDLIAPTRGGWVAPDAIAAHLKPDTLLVSVMHANNETGVLQRLDGICEVLRSHEAYLHVDAAQAYGKDLAALRDSRIDLISVSAHKIFGPKGVGALIARRRGFDRAPLTPLLFGGGQERGLRPGTAPVALIAGFGEAARMALKDSETRQRRCEHVRRDALAVLGPLAPTHHADPERQMSHVLAMSFAGVDAEALMLALKQHVAISNGAACTSQHYQTSHVLAAMGLSQDEIAGAIRVSWSHLTPAVDWASVASVIRQLRT